MKGQVQNNKTILRDSVIFYVKYFHMWFTYCILTSPMNENVTVFPYSSESSEIDWMNLSTPTINLLLHVSISRRTFSDNLNLSTRRQHCISVHLSVIWHDMCSFKGGRLDGSMQTVKRYILKILTNRISCIYTLIVIHFISIKW